MSKKTSTPADDTRDPVKYPWRHIPFANSTGDATGHHYINNRDKTDQWQVIFYPRGNVRAAWPWHATPHVEVRVLTDYDANEWETRSLTATGGEGQ